ncbi:MAG: hypothetical protein M1834_008888 [Cirrosporium novae-zelandiae]|nr:MAG: hypothetical protein M1834_008888 [Cirrosporium novae-zelandiae]
MAEETLGQSIPPNTDHAVSVSLPTWRSCVGYEEGEQWVVQKMQLGYPRFFISKHITSLADTILAKYGHTGQAVILLPTRAIANRCIKFLRNNALGLQEKVIKVMEFVSPLGEKQLENEPKAFQLRLVAVLYPEEHGKITKAFWQHSGDGISSRHAEFCHKALEEGYLVESQHPHHQASKLPAEFHKGPRRYQRSSVDLTKSPPHTPKEISDGKEFTQFIEERFGRNLDPSLATNAKVAIRRRIAGSLIDEVDITSPLSAPKSDARIANLTEDDVYLYPCGMSSIFNMHRLLLASCETTPPPPGICFGFPYTDTLKILEKFNPSGCKFYPNGSEADISDLERLLESGQRFLGLFCECPSNPLLNTPNLHRLRALATKYSFPIIIDETIGTFLNISVLPLADAVVSSLTKIFSGDCNVMGGSAILNPQSPGSYYETWKSKLASSPEAGGYEDTVFPHDALFLERNSRGFISRIARINSTTLALCTYLSTHPLIKNVYYPYFSPTRANYEALLHKTPSHPSHPEPGYGGLFSITFHTTQNAMRFYDALDVAKGPSLGTNFTLASPYTLLAHYQELGWAEGCGIEGDLVRVSVGLEEEGELVGIFTKALEKVEAGET